MVGVLYQHALNMLDDIQLEAKTSHPHNSRTYQQPWSSKKRCSNEYCSTTKRGVACLVSRPCISCIFEARSPGGLETSSLLGKQIFS
ncbi:hypothetical protein ACOSP7_017351 [Xanthoceras sorbifolium]